MGMFVLSKVASVADKQLQAHLNTLMTLFSKTLDDSDNPMVPYYTIITMTNLVFQVGTDHINTFQLLIPKVLSVVHQMLSKDEDQACEAMQIFDELVESDVAIIAPHIRTVVDFCLKVSAEKQFGDNIRIKAMSFLAWVTRCKKKAIIKFKLVSPILNTMFPIMCSPVDDDDDDDEEEGAEANTPATYAGQVIDTLALHIPPDKLLPKLLQLVEPALVSEDHFTRKGAYLAMGVIVDGCSEKIRQKYLQTMVQCIRKGIDDPHGIVRDAALFALGQCAEYLQPDVCKYAADILPLLLTLLEVAPQASKKDSSRLSKTFYALETFCESLGKDILPYLPLLMERLVTILNMSPQIRIKELAICTLASVASAAEEDFLPYFPATVETLKTFLMVQSTEQSLPMQIQAIDTLGVLARTVGKENFLPLAEECIQVSLKLLDEVNEPDMRRCVYGLLAAISALLKEKMAPHLQTIVVFMVDSIKSTEGINVHYGSDAEEAFRIFDDDDEEDTMDEEDIADSSTDEDEDDDPDIQGFSVENSFLEEKEDACCALGELAENVGPAFFPYLYDSYMEVHNLLRYPASSIRKGAATSAGHICKFIASSAKMCPDEKIWNGAVSIYKDLAIPKMLEMVQIDKDRMVVTCVLEVLKDILDMECRLPLGENEITTLAVSIQGVLQRKITAQQYEFDEPDSELDDDEAEYDTLLIETAGDLIPILAKLASPENFSPFFINMILPELKRRLRKTAATSDKSFAIGTIAETIDAYGPKSVQFVPELYPLIMTCVQDQDEEVRSNAVYGLGVLTMNSGGTLDQQFETILKTLVQILQSEKDERVQDNCCASICRLISTKVEAVPLDQIYPMILQCLPLKVDQDENRTVFSVIYKLYEAGCPQVLQTIPRLLPIMGTVLGMERDKPKTLKPEVCQFLQQFVKALYNHSPQEVEGIVVSLPPDVASVLHACIQSTA